jgi:predicted metal-binding protein
MGVHAKETSLSSSRHADAGTLLVKPKFGGVALVCGDCQKRSNGPSKLKAKEVRSLLKKELHNLPVRLRIVQCSCLGLCPRKALAVSAVADGQVLAAEIRSEDEARAVAIALARALS